MAEHTVFSDDAWIVSLVEYIAKVLTASKTPVVGICFGHQIIGRALGAKTGVAPGGWEIAVDNVQLNAQGQELFGQPSLVRLTQEASKSPSLTLLATRTCTRCTVMK